MDWVIEARDLTKTYKMGEFDVQALRGVSFTIERGEVRFHYGTFRLGQIHHDEYAWLFGQADIRRIYFGWRIGCRNG